MKKLFFLTFIAFFLEQQVNAQYCPLFGNCDASIIYVNLNGFTNTTTCGSGTEDYTSSVLLEVQPGQTPTLEAAWDGFSDSQIYVWIDWDNSQSFDTGTESYFINSSAVGTRGSTVIVVPDDAVVGDTYRMRMVLATPYEPVDPCTGVPAGIFGISEVEEYLITVSDTPPPAPTDYCDAYGTGCADFIDRVNFPGDNISIDNISACNGYGDFIDQMADVTPGNPYLVLVSRNVNYANATTVVLIDWNKDFDFDETDERYVSDTSPISTDRNVVVTVPVGVAVGYYRMRIAGGDMYGTSCGPIGTGEAEDYTIRVGNPVQCAEHITPVNDSVNVCTNGLTISWSAPSSGPNPTGYKLSLGTDVNATNVLDGQDVGLVTSYAYPTNLTPNTKYYYLVTAYNEDGDATDCSVFSFTTSANADPIIDQITLDGVDVYNTEVCIETDLAINSTTSNGTGAISYNWTGDVNPLSGNVGIANPIFNSSIAGQYFKLFLTVTDDNTCSAVDSVEIFVNDKPIPGTLVSDKNEVCPAESFNLSISGYGGVIVDWENKSGLNPFSSLGVTAETMEESIIEETIYRVLLEENGCTEWSNEVTIVYNEAPAQASISADPNTVVCEGDVVLLTSSVSGTIVWNDAESSTTTSIEVLANGSFTVTNTDPVTGCSAVSDEVQVLFNPLPSTPSIEQQGDSLVTNPLQIVNWLDADDNVVFVGESIKPERIEGQIFKVVAVDENGCTSDESNELLYDHTVSIATHKNLELNIFPNPAQDVLQITGNYRGVAIVRDVSGRITSTFNIKDHKAIFSVSHLEAGVYFIQTTEGITQTFVKD